MPQMSTNPYNIFETLQDEDDDIVVTKNPIRKYKKKIKRLTAKKTLTSTQKTELIKLKEKLDLLERRCKKRTEIKSSVKDSIVEEDFDEILRKSKLGDTRLEKERRHRLKADKIRKEKLRRNYERKTRQLEKKRLESERQERLNSATKVIKKKYIKEINKYDKQAKFDRNQLALKRFLNNPKKRMFIKLSMIYHPDKRNAVVKKIKNNLYNTLITLPEDVINVIWEFCQEKEYYENICIILLNFWNEFLDKKTELLIGN
jgi:hypothetical protein